MESNELGLLPEGSPGHVDAVLSNEALLGVGDSAAAGVLAHLARVRQQLLLHAADSVDVLTAAGHGILHIIHVIYLSISY